MEMLTCIDGIENDCDGYMDAQDDGCLFPECGTKFAPQDGPHIWDLLDPADDSFIKRNCEWCHLDDTGTIDERNACQRCHADINDASDPLNGVIKDIYKDPNTLIPYDPPYGFGTALNVKMHSSDEIGTTYGDWGVNVTCLTCHNPHMQEQDNSHGTSYGMLVKEFICLDNPVTGLDTNEIIEFTSATGPGSFADGPPANENICEMCHTQTNHHRRDDAPAAPGGQAHEDGNDCSQCHLHSTGFDSTPPLPDAPHNDVATPGFPADCQVCHDGSFTNPIPNSKCEGCHAVGTPIASAGGADTQVRGAPYTWRS